MRKTILLLLLFWLLAIIAFIIENDGAKIVIIATIAITAVKSNKINEILVFCGLSLVLNSFSSPIYWMIACLPLFANKNLIASIEKYSKYLVFLFMFAILSFVFGNDSELNTMIVFFMAVLLFIQAIEKTIALQDLWLYSVFSLFILLFILFYVGLTEGMTLKFGRLSLDGSIRTVANASAFPAFISWSLLFQKSKSIKMILLIITGTVSSVVLLLTVSKGAIAAVIFGVVATAFFSVSKKSVLSLILMVGVLYFVFSNYVFTLADYRFDRFYEEYNGFSGRTDIWAEYLAHFSSSIKTIILGFGPGDTKRFSFADEMYAHSFYFDLLLSYGVLMTILFFIVIIRVTILIFKSKNATSIGLFLFTLTLYATHGVVTVFPFYIYIGTACVMSKTWIFVKGGQLYLTNR